MKLFDIQEPGEQNDYPVGKSIGIDLGTTNSLVAYSLEHKPYVIKAPNNNQVILPSIVAVEDRKIIIGSEALSFEGSVSSFKRLMGKGLNDINVSSLPYKISAASDASIIKLDLNGTVKTPIELSSEILKTLKMWAEEYFADEVSNAVITVPAYFDDAARQATKNAAQLAGLNVLRLLNEPTAAALAYGLDKKEYGTFAVYDLGGGTFDVSILKYQKGVFQVLSTAGDTELGGDDFDFSLYEFLCNLLNQKLDLKQGLIAARHIKEHLSSHDYFEGEIFGQECTISRKEFEDLIIRYVNKTLKILKKALKDAEIEASELDEIILVGGSTRTPLIKQKIEDFIGKAPLDSINPDQIVALGAAIQAEALTYGSENVLLDVIPLSLGIELLGGISEIIIPRNSPIPIEYTRTYTTEVDGQTGFKIHVIQGESERVSECRSLAYFELKGIPSLPAGQPRIDITFKIDVDGLLTVTAYERLTKTIQEITIKPSYGLSEETLINLLNNA
jgi:molecular chaperone HscA